MAFIWSWDQDYCVEAMVGFVASVGVDNGLRGKQVEWAVEMEEQMRSLDLDSCPQRPGCVGHVLDEPLDQPWDRE